jgi:hypothetical protein
MEEFDKIINRMEVSLKRLRRKIRRDRLDLRAKLCR